MIRVTPEIEIDPHHIRMVFVRSDGPGGQNVNKVATAVQLRLDLNACENLPPHVRSRIRTLGKRYLTAEGEIVIDARRYRSQARNRTDAMDRLVKLIARAAVIARPRRKTRPTAASRRKRLADKRHRSETKTLRRRPRDED